MEELHDIVLGNPRRGVPPLRDDFYEHKESYEKLQEAAAIVAAKAAGRAQVAAIAWAVLKYFVTPAGLLTAGLAAWSYIKGVWNL